MLGLGKKKKKNMNKIKKKRKKKKSKEIQNSENDKIKNVKPNTNLQDRGVWTSVLSKSKLIEPKKNSLGLERPKVASVNSTLIWRPKASMTS